MLVILAVPLPHSHISTHAPTLINTCTHPQSNTPLAHLTNSNVHKQTPSPLHHIPRDTHSPTQKHTQTHTHTHNTHRRTHTIATKGLHLIPPSTPYHHHNHRQHQKPHPSGQGVKTFPVMLGREQSIGTFTIIEGLLS